MRLESWGRYLESAVHALDQHRCPNCDSENNNWSSNTVGFDATPIRDRHNQVEYKVIRECAECFMLFWHHIVASNLEYLEMYAQKCPAWPKDLL